MKVLYLDPGYTRTGWAVFDDATLIEVGLIETQPGNTVRKSDDVVTRCRQIARAIADQVQRHGIQRVAWEVPPGGAQSASALAALARVTAIVSATCELLQVIDTRFTPQAVKVAATGRLSASKDEIEAVVIERWPAVVKQLPRAKARREHICDALAVRMADEQVGKGA